jgi:hypothetical protein
MDRTGFGAPPLLPSGHRGNGSAAKRENPFVDVIAELFEVARDLCAFASLFSAARQRAWATALLEQCADLLAHRGQLVARLCGDGPSKGHANSGNQLRFAKGIQWTN